MDCRWTVIFKFLAAVMLLLFLNGIILSIGTYKWNLRAMGMCCNCLLGCVLNAAIIVTGIYRFNTVGTLASMSLAPAWTTGFNDSTEVIEYGNLTYNDVGKVIAAFFGLTILMWFCMCCQSVYFRATQRQIQMEAFREAK